MALPLFESPLDTFRKLFIGSTMALPLFESPLDTFTKLFILLHGWETFPKCEVKFIYNNTLS